MILIDFKIVLKKGFCLEQITNGELKPNESKKQSQRDHVNLSMWGDCKEGSTLIPLYSDVSTDFSVNIKRERTTSKIKS